MIFKPLILRAGQIEQQQSGDGIKLNLGIAIPLVIVSGVIAISGSYHSVDTEGAAPTDNLDNILGGQEGDVLILKSTNDGRTVVVRDNVGNCRISGNFQMNHSTDTITLLFNGTFWLELSRSNNG